MRLFLVLFLFFLQSAFAHQSALTGSGEKARWPMTTVPLVISANSSDLTSTQIRNIINNSLKEWNSASNFKIVSGTGVNSISFKEDFSEYGSGVVGVTEVTYNSGGVIQKADIFLNDKYNFKSTPGYYYNKDAYLGDVVTHELGHFSGLSHSEVLDSSMFYSSFVGQATLSYDDKSGIRTKYASGYGSISGTVMGGSHIPVLGVHVQAISRRTGQAVGAVTDENGKFFIGGLDINDSFYIYSSPLKNPETLPKYFANTQSEFCPGTFTGGFFQACGKESNGSPNVLNLTSAHPHQDVGIVTINCSLKNNPDYISEKLDSLNSSDSVTNSHPIFDYGFERRSEKAFVGFFLSSATTGWSKWDSLTVDLRSYPASSGSQKYLKVSLTGRKLGNQLEYEMMVIQNDDGSSATILRKDVSSLPKETDLSVILPLSSDSSENFFEIQIRAKQLSDVLLYDIFPVFETFSGKKELPYLLIASLYENSGGPEGLRPLMDSESNLSDNSSCLEAPYTFKVSKAITPNEKKTTEREAAPTASCGTIEPPSDGGGFPPGVTLILGFFLAALASEVLKNYKKFLS